MKVVLDVMKNTAKLEAYTDLKTLEDVEKALRALQALRRHMRRENKIAQENRT